MKAKILDGTADLNNGNAFITPMTSYNSDSEPHALRFKVKAGLTSFKLSGFIAPENVTAVDWGRSTNVDYTPFSTTSKTCGSEVTIFMRPNSNSFNSPLYIYQEELSLFLSQIDELITPFPKWFGYPQEIALIIDNPNFTAPDGIFENLDVIPTFWSTYGGASTFKTAPKIWADLKEFGHFPYYVTGDYNYNNIYAPFKECTSVTKILPQGEFGEELERLGPCDFMQFDADGYADPSAYPFGGAPRSIESYTMPVDKYSFDRGYTYPQFDMSRCEVFKDGYKINKVYIGSDTAASGATLPVGISFNEAHVLRHLTLSLPKIVLESGNYTGYFYYGAKALGIKVPESVEKAYGIFEMDNMYVTEQDEPGNNPPLFPDYVPSDQKAIQPLTPEFAKTKLSFPYGAALEKIFPANENLIIPEPNDVLKSVSNYALNKGASAGVTYVVKNGADWGYYQVPALPAGCEVVQSYCEDTYANQTLGASSFLKFGETGEEEEIHVTGNVTIPALPQSVRIVRNMLKGTFRGARGNAKDTRITNPEAAERKTYMFYGNPAGVEEYQTGMNVTANFKPQVDGLIEEEWGKRYSEFGTVEDGHNLMKIFIAENSGQLPETYMTNLLTGGIVIESGPLPNLEFAINWQQDTWLGATIDPSSIDSLIVPLPAGTKSENAYLRTLQIGMPSAHGQLYFYSGSTWGRKDDGSLAQNEDGCNRPIDFVTWVNPFAPVDLKQYDRYLSDIDLPSFTLTNQEGQTYDAFNNVFGNIYGDPDSFFNAYGVDSTLTTTEERRSYVGLSEPDYVELNNMPWAQFNFTWKKSKMPADFGFLSNKWLSNPRLVNEIPSGEKHPSQQEALYVYKYQYARINNAPDSVPATRGISDEWSAEAFRNETLTW
jgi:hypothetical protein